MGAIKFNYLTRISTGYESSSDCSNFLVECNYLHAYNREWIFSRVFFFFWKTLLLYHVTLTKQIQETTKTQISEQATYAASRIPSFSLCPCYGWQRWTGLCLDFFNCCNNSSHISLITCLSHWNRSLWGLKNPLHIRTLIPYQAFIILT